MEGDSRESLFLRAHKAFQRRGLLGRALRLDCGGKVYSVRCDDACFSIYRVNDKSYLPPGLPGWMVCRVSAGECFSLDQDETSCGLDQTPQQTEQAAAWLEMALTCLPGEES